MATIKKKLIHFERLADFENRLAAGDILSHSIVWIKDAKKIWTHGTLYDCKDQDLSNYPTFDDIADKQDKLVSGTNIKTVNGVSILGSGNLETVDYVYTPAFEINESMELTMTSHDEISSGMFSYDSITGNLILNYV